MSYKKNTEVEVLPVVDLFQELTKKETRVGDASQVSTWYASQEQKDAISYNRKPDNLSLGENYKLHVFFRFPSVEAPSRAGGGRWLMASPATVYCGSIEYWLLTQTLP